MTDEEKAELEALQREADAARRRYTEALCTCSESETWGELEAAERRAVRALERYRESRRLSVN